MLTRLALRVLTLLVLVLLTLLVLALLVLLRALPLARTLRALTLFAIRAPLLSQGGLFAPISRTPADTVVPVLPLPLAA